MHPGRKVRYPKKENKKHNGLRILWETIFLKMATTINSHMFCDVTLLVFSYQEMKSILPSKRSGLGASLVVQWLRIRLPMHRRRI